MLTADRRKIFNELMGLYKAQLPLVEPTAMNTGRGWTITDLEPYDQRAERIAIRELRDHPEDVGQVIGHHGRIVGALRTIFGAAGMKLHKCVRVEILN